MMRRLRGPLGGALIFLIVVGLVVGGLGWVTLAALRVERAQQDATAQARQVNDLRVALWRLDGGMIAPLGLEDSRPFDHFSPTSTPLSNFASNSKEVAAVANMRVPSPLLTAPLPDWMVLHFQIDPRSGWDSPQVPSKDFTAELRANAADFSPSNATPERAKLLAELRAQFRPTDVASLLSARDPTPVAAPTPANPPPGPAVPATNLTQLDSPPTITGVNGNASAPAQQPQQPQQPNPVTRYSAQAQRSQQQDTYSANMATNTVGLSQGKQVLAPNSNSEYQSRAQIVNRSLNEQKATLDNGFNSLSYGNNAGTILLPPGGQPAGLPKPAAWTAPPSPAPAVVHLGAMHPLWLRAVDGTERLTLVRTARLDNRVIYQGVLIDWPRLQEVLKEEVADLFPNASLVPVRDTASELPERTMTVLPVQLDPGSDPEPAPAGWTPLRIGLVLAWAAALIAIAAVGLGGWSLISLSERRIRFVSAVTHELRTPLTSLRLYLDMLSSGMVKDEAKRAEYLITLNTESDRLHRLIENVLDYSRLENRPVRAEKCTVRVCDLLRQIHETWSERCTADGRELVAECKLADEAEVTTDPQIVQQIVGNLIDNARKYSREAADKRIWLRAESESGRIVLAVEDRGPGVPPRERSSIFRAFRRGATADTTAGGAGLGLALAKQWSEALGGRLTYHPAAGGTGACFRLELPCL